jgi:hypothetical protein
VWDWAPGEDFVARCPRRWSPPTGCWWCVPRPTSPRCSAELAGLQRNVGDLCVRHEVGGVARGFLIASAPRPTGGRQRRAGGPDRAQGSGDPPHAPRRRCHARRRWPPGGLGRLRWPGPRDLTIIGARSAPVHLRSLFRISLDLRRRTQTDAREPAADGWGSSGMSQPLLARRGSRNLCSSHPASRSM